MSFNVPEDHRITRIRASLLSLKPEFATDMTDGNNGVFVLPFNDNTLLCIASDGLGWEHVSVTLKPDLRCPTWEELCYAKDQFWTKDCTVVQYHPSAEDYRSFHPRCLHLWRPSNGTVEHLPTFDTWVAMPDPKLVGAGL